METILASLRTHYPAPPIDPAWFRNVIHELTNAGLLPTVEELNEQYLYTDLGISTTASQTLPTQEKHDIHLFPQPTVLQIEALTEIASSAFQLHTTYEQRRDILEGHTAIRRMDDDEEEDSAVEEGKIPNYTRGMLKMQVGDGRRSIKAMEYKKIEDLVLGNTMLGCKILVQNVRVLRGVLLLTPENTQILGGSVEERQKVQQRQFVNGLLERMGKPIPPDVASAHIEAEPVRAGTQIPMISRSREARPTMTPVTRNSTSRPSRTTIREPPSVDEEEDDFDFDDSFIRQIDETEVLAMSTNAGNGTAQAGPSRLAGSNSRSLKRRADNENDDRYTRPSPTVGKASKRSGIRTAHATSTAQSERTSNRAVDDPGGRRGQMSSYRANPQVRSYAVDDSSDMDFEVDDSFIRHVDEVEARITSQNKGRSRSQVARADHEIIEISD